MTESGRKDKKRRGWKWGDRSALKGRGRGKKGQEISFKNARNKGVNNYKNRGKITGGYFSMAEQRKAGFVAGRREEKGEKNQHRVCGGKKKGERFLSPGSAGEA